MSGDGFPVVFSTMCQYTQYYVLVLIGNFQGAGIGQTF